MHRSVALRVYRIHGHLLPFMFKQPGVLSSLLMFFQLGIQLRHGGGMFGPRREIQQFMRILLKVVKFHSRTLNERGAIAVSVGLVIPFENPLPRRRLIQVRSKRKRSGRLFFE